MEPLGCHLRGRTDVFLTPDETRILETRDALSHGAKKERDPCIYSSSFEEKSAGPRQIVLNQPAIQRVRTK